MSCSGYTQKVSERAKTRKTRELISCFHGKFGLAAPQVLLSRHPSYSNATIIMRTAIAFCALLALASAAAAPAPATLSQAQRAVQTALAAHTARVHCRYRVGSGKPNSKLTTSKTIKKSQFHNFCFITYVQHIVTILHLKGTPLFFCSRSDT